MVTPPSFPVFDADNHLYETEDALTRHLPAQHEDLFRFVEVNGRKKIVVRSDDHRVHPEPDLRGRRPARGPDGLLRGRQPGGQVPAGDHRRADPRRAGLPGARGPPRADRRAGHRGRPSCSRRWPASSRSACATTPSSPTIAIHALNEWLHDDWTYNYEDRIFATPVVTRASSTRASTSSSGCSSGAPGPSSPPGAGRRPPGHPLAVPARVRPVLGAGRRRPALLVALHASDSGYQRYLNTWEGTERRVRRLPARRPSPPWPTTGAPSRTPWPRPSATGCSPASPRSGS